MSAPAVRAVARHEWAAHRRSLLALGLVVGVFGGLIVTVAGLTARTATAPDRLARAVAAGDARVEVFGEPARASDVVALPQVERAWTAGMAVARLDGPTVSYVGILAGPPRPAGMLRPVLVEGREPDPADAAEVLVTEDAARALGVGPGDDLGVSLLTPEEVSQFDVGFGEPDGPSVQLTVSGVGRVPPGVLDNSPLLATPAFADRYGASAAGTSAFVSLHGGAHGLPAFRRAVARAGEAVPVAPGSEEFAPVAVDDLGAGTADARASARVLVGGLTATVMVSVVAGLLAVGQALSRHHSASAPAQAVEAALGLTRRERTLARLVPALPAALVAGAVAAVVALVGARLGPPGAVGRLEPEPGWWPQPAPIVLGAAGVALAVAGAAAVTARRAGPSTRRPTSARPASTAWSRLVPWRSAWGLAGGAFALGRGGRARGVPVRASLVGAVVGVAGLAAGLTVGASLDRLVATPERWGWAGDLVVIDATDEIVAGLRDDGRIDAVAYITSSSVRLGDEQVAAHTVEPVVGELGWTMLAGRAPAAPDEVVLGTRQADRLDVAVGASVPLGGGRAEVVGVGIGPPLAGERLGDSVLLTPAGLQSATRQQGFREAMVRAVPGVDRDELAGDLAARYEVEPRALPAEVRDLAELGALPDLLGAFLAALGAVALVHALAVATRRHDVDLAVLRALGSTAAQAAGAVVAMAVTTVAVGVAVGLPLGWATARLVWGEVAGGAGVAGDVVVPLSVAAAAVAALGAAVLLAVVPARRAVRVPPSRLLRAE